MSGLVVTGLHKAFDARPVLAGLDLAVPDGSLTAILGPSGSGKTTLLRVVAGFEPADRGTVAIGGVDATGLPPEQRRIGYVPQEGALFPHLSAERNVAFGVPRRRRRSGLAGDLLELVGMGGMGRRYPHELSGGQQQRVALARALAVEPRLVLLDEPFSSLDAALRASVRADVAGILRRAGATALLVTHDQDEALSWADHVAIIRDGRIGQFGTPQQIYASPDDPELARFLGDANLVPGVVDGRSVRTALGVLPVEGPASEPGSEVLVLVRPEQLELIAEPRGAYLTGRVEDYEFFGHDAVVRVRPDPEGAGGTGSLVVRVAGGRAWEPGARVGVTTTGPVRAWARPGVARTTPA
ncbi:MAG: ABC transporter ATP-binding protein [Acidimicrobiales bacterium]